MICRLRAPTALSKPISAVRWLTATSMTFMINTPATTRLMAAMAASPAVIIPKIESNVDTQRILRDDGDVLFAGVARLDDLDDVAPRRLTSTSRLARLDEDPEHAGRIEDLLRVRDRQDQCFVDVEPAREPLLGEHADDPATRVADAQPLAERLLDGEQLATRRSLPEHANRGRGVEIAGGRKRPDCKRQCWIADIGALVPSTVMSRSRARHDAVPAPITSGVTLLDPRAALPIAIVSCKVSSRAVSPTSSPWMPPPAVSALPGSTINSCVPTTENWPVT